MSLEFLVMRYTESMPEQAAHQPKISLPEALLLLEFMVIVDVIGIILALLAVGEVLNTILDVLTFPITQIYFRLKGVRAGYDLAAGLLELIPFVNALPLRTIGVIVVIALDWYFPEVAAHAQGASNIKKPIAAANPAASH